jgi:hypothetical protein
MLQLMRLIGILDWLYCQRDSGIVFSELLILGAHIDPGMSGLR